MMFEEMMKRIESSNQENVIGNDSQLIPIKQHLVENKRLLDVTRTGKKKQVKAFIQMWKGQLQVTFKYGMEYYTFAVVDANEDEQAYNRRVNIKGQPHEKKET